MAWDIDGDVTAFTQWLNKLPDSDQDFVLTVLKAIRTSDELPWYYGKRGDVKGVRVRKFSHFGPLIHMLILESDGGEIAIVFSVRQESQSSGQVDLLLFGRLQELSRQYSIEAAAYFIMGEKPWLK